VLEYQEEEMYSGWLPNHEGYQNNLKAFEFFYVYEIEFLKSKKYSFGLLKKKSLSKYEEVNLIT
jgi:hypothetical protein